MDISVIASGSNGNCCLVEEKGSSILIDAGKSCREIELRMNSLGKSLENINGIIITHAHHDHISGAGVISRKYGIPVYITKQVYSETANKLGSINIKHFIENKKFKINNLEIKPIQTSHNVTSCGFVIGKFGLFTDTGVVTQQMKTILPKLKAILLESNHDIDMVINSQYPYFLKNWILSDQGHLSNIHACELVQEKGRNLSQVLLGHLSGNNNTPEKAIKTFETLVKHKINFDICSREKESGEWNL